MTLTTSAGLATELDTMSRYAQRVLLKESIDCTEMTEAKTPDGELLIASVEFEDCSFVVTYLCDPSDIESMPAISIHSRRFPHICVEIPSMGGFTVRQLNPEWDLS